MTRKADLSNLNVNLNDMTGNWEMRVKLTPEEIEASRRAYDAKKRTNVINYISVFVLAVTGVFLAMISGINHNFHKKQL